MEYPTWMYHAEHGARLFPDAESFEAAGDGWEDHPEKCKKEEQEAPKKRPYNRKG